MNFFHIFYKTFTKLIYLREVPFSFVHKIYWKCKNTLNFNTVLLDFRFLCHIDFKIHNLVQEWAMKLGFGPKYFLKCVLTDSVNNPILKKKIDFGLNGPDRVTYHLGGTQYLGVVTVHGSWLKGCGFEPRQPVYIILLHSILFILTSLDLSVNGQSLGNSS